MHMQQQKNLCAKHGAAHLEANTLRRIQRVAAKADPSKHKRSHQLPCYVDNPAFKGMDPTKTGIPAPTKQPRLVSVTEITKLKEAYLDRGAN